MDDYLCNIKTFANQRILFYERFNIFRISLAKLPHAIHTKTIMLYILNLCMINMVTKYAHEPM